MEQMTQFLKQKQEVLIVAKCNVNENRNVYTQDNVRY